MKTEYINIIKECQKGKQAAQHKAYEWLSPRMYAICLQYTKNRMEAEDCLQEGFIKVFTKIDSYKFKGSFEGWVRRIIVNTVIENFRKKEAVSEHVCIDDLSEIDNSETEINENELNADFLHRLIMELPTQYRIVFSLYVLEEYTHEEISNKLNISIGTSKSNLSRARKWLQNKIEQIRKNEINRYVSVS